jgi:hypothetical protein
MTAVGLGAAGQLQLLDQGRLADRRTSSPPLRRVHADALVRTLTPAESIKIMPRRSSTM